jgi:hypothetical protein
LNAPSLLKRRDIIDALRIGSVPRRGLEHFAVGLERFGKIMDEELDSVAAGNGRFKAVRGEYGTGKTFFARWLEHRALAKNFATTVVQISEAETPLHKFEAIYRRALEALQTKEWGEGAFRQLVERWFYGLEEEIIAEGKAKPSDEEAILIASAELFERRVKSITAAQPQFAAALRGFQAARARNDVATADGLLGWLAGQGNVAAHILKDGNVKGELETATATGFLRGFLELLRQTGRRGLVLVLDEVETIQRAHPQTRDRGLQALHALIEDLVAQRYPGLYVLITGTPVFFDQGVRRLTPLAQRLHTEFGPDPRHDSSRAPQVRLQPFDFDKLVEVGRRVRDLYPSTEVARVTATVNDDIVRALAQTVVGGLGGKVGAAPRVFLRKLVNLLDKVDEHPDFDPVTHANLPVERTELNDDERAVAGISRSVDEIELDVGARDQSSGKIE